MHTLNSQIKQWDTAPTTGLQLKSDRFRGEVKVLMEPSQHKIQYPKLLPDDTESFGSLDSENYRWEDESADNLMR